MTGIWLEKDKHPSSVTFICPFCLKKVIYYHGSTAKSRRISGTMKRCPYEYCPWCGKKVWPLRINYISD